MAPKPNPFVSPVPPPTADPDSHLAVMRISAQTINSLTGNGRSTVQRAVTVSDLLALGLITQEQADRI